MFKHEVEKFAEYQVYKKDGKVICLTNTIDEAKYIAKLYAWNDKGCETYFVSGVNGIGDFVIGGGWYIAYKMDKEKNILICSELG